MPCYHEIHCPCCDSNNIIKLGTNAKGTQRYLCQSIDCETQTFMLDYCYKACELGITEKIVEMAINGSGIRDTARVLKINKNTVINTLKKKESCLAQVNPNFQIPTAETRVDLVCEEAEIDEQWSFVGNKPNQRWIWYAVEHSTNTILAYVFGKRKDVVFKALTLLDPLKIKRYYTDDWGAYERHIETDKHEVGKSNIQKIEC